METDIILDINKDSMNKNNESEDKSKELSDKYPIMIDLKGAVMVGQTISGSPKVETNFHTSSIDHDADSTREQQEPVEYVVLESPPTDPRLSQEGNSPSKNDGNASNVSTFRLLGGLTGEQKLTLVVFCICNFTVASFYALIAPFFPAEAAAKGASPLAVGFIFSIFQAVIGVFAPLFGTYISVIGARFMYASGVIVCGTSAILFGFLDACPDGTIYVVMCIIVRFTEALGATGFYTALFAIVAFVFPNNVATIFGCLELFTGLGFMVGPVLGGALYQLGGYRLPFISLGSGVTVIGIFSVFLLPKHLVHMPPREGSVWDLIRRPVVAIVSLCLICGCAALGFLDVTLSNYLKNTYQLSVLFIGLMFLVYSATYAISAPLWGFLLDKYSHCSLHLVTIGFGLSGLAFIFMGPVPFLHIPHMIWLQITSSLLLGFGLGTLVLTYPIFTATAVAHGYPDNIATYGLTAAIFHTCFSIGACIGPLVGGFLEERIPFEASAAYIGASVILSALILLAYIIIKRGRLCCRGVGVEDGSQKRNSLTPSISPEHLDATERTLLLGSPTPLYVPHKRLSLEK